MRFIISLIVVYLTFKFLKALFSPKVRPIQEGPIQPRQASNGDDLVEDPHCHTYVPLSNAHKASLMGKTLYFCSKKCLDEYTTISNNENLREVR